MRVIIPNPDKEKFDKTSKEVTLNGGYCPLAVIKNEDTRCICKDFRLNDKDVCNCGRYIRVKKD